MSESFLAAPSRRQFLQSTTAAAAVAGTAPLVLASRKSGNTNSVILGSGAHTYEVVPGWGKLPDGVRYGYTHGVIVDAQQRIFLHNQSKDSIIIFDRAGRFIKSWGPDFKDGAHGMQRRVENGTEYLYLADYVRHIVVKTTLDGEVIWTLRYPKETGIYRTEDEYKPTNVAFAPNGDFYVADGYGLSWVHQYNIKAEYIRSWGGVGKEPGKMDCPHGIWVDTRGKEPIIVVADRSNARLQMFTLNGEHLGFVYDELRAPCHFDQVGTELLIPDLHGRVTVFDKNNRLVTHLGDNPGIWDKTGWPNLGHQNWVTGKFISPHAAVVDGQGSIYVVEWIEEGRVTKLRRV